MSIATRTVGVIGVGHVGSHVALLLGMMGVADTVRLCDLNETMVTSQRQDLMDAVKFMPHPVDYVISSYEELKDCDVIVNSVGNIKILTNGNHDRDDEMAYTVPQVAATIPKVMAGGFHGYFVNITNPCDVITKLISDLSGLPKGQVLGTGTGLDTSRLVSALAQQTGVAHQSIMAFMMGEHGNSQMTPWSLVRFGGKSLDELKGQAPFDFDTEEVKNRAIEGGWVTMQGKQCTEFGIGATAATIVGTILRGKNEIMPVSAPLDGEYGEHDVFVGCPAVIGAGGMEKVVEYKLAANELADFKKCCQTIRDNYARACKLIEK
ncbi:MAG: L-lactate dehydrogenase [Megasphaera sp.]|nr:L-lactate dehydrogenase [Megasphaera sp.]MCH4188697.1 L-lactate dehydrogenase [Megasphaera sp.]MCH4218260.1 L-lactate dehydrogenase [Megasphaera sp.]